MISNAYEEPRSSHRSDSDIETEKGFLVGVHLKESVPLLNTQDSLDELELLASTASIEVIGRATQNLSRINPATFIGQGKLAEIHETMLELGADVVIFDDELSPRHQRELEKIFGEDVKVIDRSALILDIFARHAQTREGALQVELAQYEYRLPRLTRQWTHLARQSGGGAARAGGGGVGLRGPGETQLEVDRREIGRRISRLKRDLEGVRAHRSRHRDQRRRSGISVIALVGYTNAGKSTLLNTLAKSDVYAADQLFATLDPTTRRVELGKGKQVLISDTVGFIQKLPTTLIAAFRATLEEISEADLIIHVADASHANVSEQIEAVEDTLAELDLPPIPSILALNKTDLVGEAVTDLLGAFPDTTYDAVLAISAKSGDGLSELRESIEQCLQMSAKQIHVLIPYTSMDLLAYLHENGTVLHEDHLENGVAVKALADASVAARILAAKNTTQLS